jgi:hypothetical protein
MNSLQHQVAGWAEECRIGRLSRRDLLQRVLLIAGTVPAALAVLQEIGVPADAAEIAGARLATTAVKRSADTEILRCSFCNKDQNDVRQLIVAPTVCICDECVSVCNDIIEDDNRFQSRAGG